MNTFDKALELVSNPDSKDSIRLFELRIEDLNSCWFETTDLQKFLRLLVMLHGNEKSYLLTRDEYQQELKNIDTYSKDYFLKLLLVDLEKIDKDLLSVLINNKGIYLIIDVNAEFDEKTLDIISSIENICFIHEGKLYKKQEINEINYKRYLTDVETIEEFLQLIENLETGKIGDKYIDKTRAVHIGKFSVLKGLKALPRERIIQFQDKLAEHSIFLTGLPYETLVESLDFEKAVDIILSRIPENALEIDKVNYIILFLTEYVSYDYEQSHALRHASFDEEQIKKGKKTKNDVLIMKSGVCENYAVLAKYLLNRISIKCEYNSSGDRSFGGGAWRGPVSHAWNYVYIEDKPYYFDATWISEAIKPQLLDGKVYYPLAEDNLSIVPYYLLSRDSFYKTHSSYSFESLLVDAEEDYDRQKIKESIDRIKSWNKNYVITEEMLTILLDSPQHLKDINEVLTRITGGSKK